MDKLILGRIYNFNGRLYRLFRSGGAGYYSGRGCVKSTAVPNNYLSVKDAKEATLEEVNAFLEEELINGMIQTWNK
jgi:hypothetical protein